jgi:hypothetical protein
MDRTAIEKENGGASLDSAVTTAAAMSVNEQAQIFFDSGIFKDVKSAAQAFVKIAAGREIGLSPIMSMNSVYIVDNKIAYETKIFLSRLKSGGKYDYEIIKNTDKECEIAFYRLALNEGTETRIPQGKSRFTFEDAARAGLANKTSYKNYPALMLFYRAASNGIKLFCPDVLEGRPLYEDLIELTDENAKSGLKVDLKKREVKAIEITREGEQDENE